MKNIEDYLPLYHGAKLIETGGGNGELLGWMKTELGVMILTNDSSNSPSWTSIRNVQLILRPLSSMTQEEMTELKGNPLSCSFTPSQFHYLLSKHFDVFDLIEEGLAIDATTFQKEVQP